MNYDERRFEVRYFEGYEHQGNVTLKTGHKELQPPWMDLFKNIERINNIKEPRSFIGLNCYPPGFKKADGYDYFAMIQTELPNNVPESVSTKKLPAGTYIVFRIAFGKIREETNKIYKYINDKQLNVNFGFDYEEYIQSEDYSNPEAILEYAFLLNEK